MGFGKKTDFQTGRVLDLDKSYKTIIKPAVEKAGLACIRADEIVHSGIIDVPMFKQLLTADVVIADLSAYNCNAFYELGVRHALRPYSTITIAESKLVYPFDVNHIAIRSYEHLGTGIDFDEVERMRAELVKAITHVLANPTNDSPVYEFLKDLHPPSLQQAIAQEAAQMQQADIMPQDDNTLGVLMSQAEKAIAEEKWSKAKDYLADIRDLLKDPKGIRPEDPYIIQQLALATYKSKQPDARTALVEAQKILAPLKPETTNDPETLGLCGAICKRLWEIDGKRDNLDAAIQNYQRGFNLKNDYYNGINYAYLLNVRAAVSEPADAVADFVLAQRVRREVISICERLLESGRKFEPDEKYWIEATLGEAWYGLGEREKSKAILEPAYASAPKSWMRGSTEEQLGKLEKLLEKNPLALLRRN